MARPRAMGLMYFPLDTEFDSELETLLAAYHGDAMLILVRIWQAAYRTPDGEVDHASRARCAMSAMRCGVSLERWTEIVEACCELGILDAEAWQRGVLTSNGIKRRIAEIEEERGKARARTAEGRKRGKKVPAERESSSPVVRDCSPIVRPLCAEQRANNDEKTATPADDVAGSGSNSGLFADCSGVVRRTTAEQPGKGKGKEKEEEKTYVHVDPISVPSADVQGGTGGTDGAADATPPAPAGRGAFVVLHGGADTDSAPPPNKRLNKRKPPQWPPAGVEVRPLVYLAAHQLERLHKLMSAAEVDYWLEELSLAAQSRPDWWKREYADHAAVALSWRRRRAQDGKIWNEERGTYERPQPFPGQNYIGRPTAAQRALAESLRRKNQKPNGEGK